MKVDSKQYAQALYELTKDKSEKEISIVIEKYVDNLQKQGLLNKAENIIKKFTEIYNQKNKVVSAKIFTSREIEDKNVEEIAEMIKKKYQAEEVELEMTVDKALKGGIKIIVGEDIIDNSIAGKLVRLRKALSS